MTKTNTAATVSYKMDVASFDKECAAMQKAGNSVAQRIQKLAMAALDHLAEHGQVAFVNKLYVSMPNGSRKAALAAWFLQFGRVEASTKEDKKLVPFLYAKHGVNDLDGAAATPWYEAAQEKAPDELFDITKAIAALIAKAKKSAKVNDPAALKALETLASLKPAAVSA